MQQFAAAALPICAQTAIITPADGLDVKDIKVPVAGGSAGGSDHILLGMIGPLVHPNPERVLTIGGQVVRRMRFGAAAPDAAGEGPGGASPGGAGA